MTDEKRETPGTSLEVLTSHSSVPVLEALASRFERATGLRYSVVHDSAKLMRARIESGEKGDVVILGTDVVSALAGQGIVSDGSRRPFARARVGVAVRAGAPRPDIGTVDYFRRALLAARSIAHTVHGASGMYVPVLLERLGIAAEMKPKTVTRPGGYIARVVASGEAELAIQQIVELLAVPGVELVGPLPDEIQKVFETSIAVFSGSSRGAAAEALIRFLLAPAAAPLFSEKGLEQVPLHDR
jgi:molybdate transport system substrate-binding protein